MTEEEWLACGDPQAMLALVYTQCMRRRGRTPVRSERATKRSLRLFACAACRLAWGEFADRRTREAVEASEAFADDPAAVYALNAAREAVRLRHQGHSPLRACDPGWLSAGPQGSIQDRAARIISLGSSRLIERRLGFTMWAWPYQTQEQIAAWRAARPEAYRPFCDLLRDLFLTPPRRSSSAAEWRTPIAALLARAAYDERALPSGELDLARLAVLSDALEEAGCTDAAILSHLRSPGPHMRGCWALDLVLGKV